MRWNSAMIRAPAAATLIVGATVAAVLVVRALTSGNRRATAPERAVLVGVIPGMRMPESVRHDLEQDVYFVSNVDGVPSWRDGRGSIARVRPGRLHAPDLDFIVSGRRGVHLDAPTGMAIVGDTLWVADVTVVRGFHRRTGAPVATVDLAPTGARYLNDVAAGPDGALYITDSGFHIAADTALTHPGPDRIFRVRGRAIDVAAEGDTLAQPNGLAWDVRRARWILAPLGSPRIFTWRPGTPPVPFTTGPGSYDGIEALGDGRLVVTSWADSAVSVVRAGGTFRRIAGGLNGPADVGVDARRGRVLVPEFNAGRVVVYDLPRAP